jgi:hypothetical protein
VAPELVEPDELEPHAATAAATVIVAATVERLEVILVMAQVVAGDRSHQCNTAALTCRDAFPGRAVMAL